MKKYKVGFIPAYKRKLSKLLRDKEYSFTGNSAKTLKLKMELMPNMVLTIA